jgi:hypothetical protein
MLGVKNCVFEGVAGRRTAFAKYAAAVEQDVVGSLPPIYEY